MRRHHQPLQLQSSINLTNLLDIVFCLLIAFMIVAPTLDYGLDLDLPEVADAHALAAEKPVKVSISKRKTPESAPYITLEGTRVDNVKDLKERLIERRSKNPKINVIVQCDEKEESGVFLQVIGAVQGAGFESVGLETEPYDER